MDVSAICRYHILEVKKAFEGPYKEYREQAQKWGRYSDEVPSPRPGAVSAGGGHGAVAEGGGAQGPAVC